jgi:hypothetical protein
MEVPAAGNFQRITSRQVALPIVSLAGGITSKKFALVSQFPFASSRTQSTMLSAVLDCTAVTLIRQYKCDEAPLMVYFLVSEVVHPVCEVKVCWVVHAEPSEEWSSVKVRGAVVVAVLLALTYIAVGMNPAV